MTNKVIEFDYNFPEGADDYTVAEVAQQFMSKVIDWLANTRDADTFKLHELRMKDDWDNRQFKWIIFGTVIDPLAIHALIDIVASISCDIIAINIDTTAKH